MTLKAKINRTLANTKISDRMKRKLIEWEKILTNHLFNAVNVQNMSVADNLIKKRAKYLSRRCFCVSSPRLSCAKGETPDVCQQVQCSPELQLPASSIKSAVDKDINVLSTTDSLGNQRLEPEGITTHAY